MVVIDDGVVFLNHNMSLVQVSDFGNNKSDTYLYLLVVGCSVKVSVAFSTSSPNLGVGAL